MNIYEQLGRLWEAYEKECDGHRNTIKLIGRLKEGEVSLEDVVVKGDAWEVRADGQDAEDVEVIVGENGELRMKGQ